MRILKLARASRDTMVGVNPRPPPWHYHPGDVVSVEFRALPDATAATLPQGLTPDQETNGHAVARFIDRQFAGKQDEYLERSPTCNCSRI